MSLLLCNSREYGVMEAWGLDIGVTVMALAWISYGHWVFIAFFLIS